MASTIRFFEQPSVESRYEKKSDKYFPTEPVKPVVKKIDKEEESARLLRWLKLLPAVILLALGMAFLPHFGLACAITVGILFTNLITSSIIMLFFEPDNGKYRDSISKSQLMVSLGAPILEELIFRGAILQLLLLLIGLAFPPMLLFPCLNLGISVAAAAAIFITAGLFGVAHAGNGKNNHAQVVATFVMGLAFGFFAVQFGLLVAIGAHILNNTIASALGNLLSSPTTKKEEKVVESLENNFSELKMA